MRVRTVLALIAALAVTAATPAAAAADVDVEVVASGLDNPRHVAIGPHGDIYVAEAGRGGDPATSRSCFDSAEGPSCTGATGAVTRIERRHGDQERIVTGLASFAPAGGGSAIGPHGIFAAGHSVYVTNGGPTAPTRGEPPAVVLRDPTLTAEEPVSRLFGRVLEIEDDGDVDSVADVWAFERANNPDAAVGNALVDSNPVDVLADARRLLVPDAGGNTLLRVSRRGRISVLSLFPNVDTPGPGGGIIPMQAVPTGVVLGPDGAYYVSQLTGFPFPVGGSRVFRVDRDTGERTDYATGFTNVIDLDFGRDGTLYVLEIDRDSFLGPSTDGGLWKVPPGGGTPERIGLPAGTLTEPGGIAVGWRGRLFASNHAREADAGEVLEIDLDD
jgi:hypothetical protein